MATDFLYGRRTKLQHYQSQLGFLKSERTPFDLYWQDLADFILPARFRVVASDRNRGNRRNQSIIDSTATFATRTLQSGLHAGLTSPARPWMRLTTPDPDLAEFAPVREWLHVVTQRMLTVFQQTNLYNVLPTLYGDLGTFGTGAMAVVPHRKVFRAYSYPVGSYVLGQDADGKIAVFMREYRLTVRQLVEAFGRVEGSTDIQWASISSHVKSLWDSAEYDQPIDVVWVVAPNPQADPRRLGAKYLPFTSCHFELGKEADSDSGRGFLRESGFKTCPIFAPRWEVTGEDSYGTFCPGMIALGDVRQLQTMHREKGKAVKKIIDPPVVGPAVLRNQKTSLLPGDITYLDTREGMQGLKPVHEIRIDLSHLTLDMQLTQDRIRRAFYEDLFLMLASSDAQRGAQPVTAREVQERHEEKLIALGPVLERTNDELLDPLVDRVWGMMEDRGLIPEPPDEIDGVELKVEYTSIMAQAQKLVGVVAQDRFVQTVAPMAEIAGPAILNKVDWNQVIDNYADTLGVDPRIIRSNDEADALTAAQAKQAQDAAEAQQAKDMGAALKSAGTTPMEGDTALTRLAAVAGAA